MSGDSRRGLGGRWEVAGHLGRLAAGHQPGREAGGMEGGMQGEMEGCRKGGRDGGM